MIRCLISGTLHSDSDSSGTFGTFGTLKPESPTREPPIGTFRNNLPKVPNIPSHADDGLSSQSSPVESIPPTDCNAPLPAHLPKGYDVADFADAFGRYLPSNRHSDTSQSNRGFPANDASATDGDCGGYDDDDLASKTAGCGGVADEIGETGTAGGAKIYRELF